MFRMRKPATGLALMLAGAALCAQTLPELPAAQLQTLTQNQATRAAQAQAWIRGQISSLGLTAADDLVVRHALTNPQGECVVRFDQLNQGSAVQGASVVVKVRPDGSMVLAGASLAKGLNLPAQAKMTPAQALQALVAKLSPTVGFSQPPTVEPIVFPTRLMGDLVLAKDDATGLLAMDPLRSAEAYTPPTPHVRGYRLVCEMQSTQAQPDVTLTVIMDGDTGAILNRSFTGPKVNNPFNYAKGIQPISGQNTLPSSAATVRHARATAVTTADVPAGRPSTVLVPTVGRGEATYSGVVDLPTTFDPALNGYGLLDTTRGANNNYFAQTRMGGYDTFGNYHANIERPAGNLVVTDLFGVFTAYTMDGLSGSEMPVPQVASTVQPGQPATVNGTATGDDIWGDGGDFLPVSDPTIAFGGYSSDAKSVAAEAMNSMTNAYEFMKYEFNRLGLDGNDNSMTVVANEAYYQGSIIHQTAASVYGADGKTVTKIPVMGIWAGAGDYANQGTAAFAEPTLLGQQMGEMLWEWVLQGQSSTSISEGKDVQRAFGNLMGQAILSVGAQHGIQRVIVEPSYQVGRNYYDGSYAVSMFKPSLDGVSPDGWYDGVSFLGNSSPEFGEGPMDRAFFYLAEYASPTLTDATYSKYLPGGMQGIGLEKCAKILYKALTEDVTDPDLSMADMRAACVTAATDLYGAASPEVIATTNAFAAVNVGGAYGQPDPIRVTFNAQNYPDNSDMGVNGPFEPNPRGSRYPMVPMGEPTQLTVNVANAADPSLTWTNQPAYYSGTGLLTMSGAQQGTITPGGVFLSPLRDTSWTIYSVQATSKADANQWAQGIVQVLEFDNDGDGNNDALDLGMLALAYGLDASIVGAVNSHIMSGFPGVGEGELQMNLAAFKTAFCN